MARRVIFAKTMWAVLLTLCVGVAGAQAQTIGTFRFQLRPYCNVVTLTVVQQGGQYQVDGFDDQCGLGPAPATGLAVFNGGGSLTFGFTIVPSPNGGPVTVDASLSLGTFSGGWRDSVDNSGTFVLIAGAGNGGSARPIALAGDISGVTAGAGLTGGALSGVAQLAVDFAATQQRVTGSCPGGQLMTSVNQNGSVVCQAVTGTAGGDITAVSAGVGLTGGAGTGDVTLAVNFGGPGASSQVARADHTHLRPNGTRNVGAGPSTLTLNVQGDNVALGNDTMAANTTGLGNVAVGNFALRFGSSASSNTAVGHSALQSATATGNTAVGYLSATQVTSGTDNVAVGWNALAATTAASFNTATGSGALQANTTGTNNTGIGRLALASNTTASESTAVGVLALALATTGGQTAVGYRALASNTTGASNTAVGLAALSETTTGTANTALGVEALANNTTGNYNTAVGSNTLGAATIAASNTAVGEGAMGATISGAQNSALGRSALAANVTGTLNTAIGNSALSSMTFGMSNVAIGPAALGGLVNGSDNIAIGHGAGSNVTTTSNNIFIGHSVSGTAGDFNVIRIGNSSHTTTYIRGISGATSASGVAVFVNSNGQLGTLTSSRRFKDEIAGLGDDVRARVQALRPVSFVYKPAFDDGTRQRQYGLVAEEVAEVFPELVVRDADGQVQTVRYHFLAPLLLAEVQRLERERAAGEVERARLEERLRRLEETVAAAARR